MSRNVWRYNLSPDGQLDYSRESNYFGRGRSSKRFFFFCHIPLNRDSYSSGTQCHTLHAKVILSTENFVLHAHKTLASSNSFTIKLKCLNLAHTIHVLGPYSSICHPFYIYILGPSDTELPVVLETNLLFHDFLLLPLCPPIFFLNSYLFFKTQVSQT